MEMTSTSTVHGIRRSLTPHTKLSDMKFPEFSSSLKITDELTCMVFDMPESRHDLILGLDFLNKYGINVNCSTLTVQWLDLHVPFRPSDHFDNLVVDELLHEAVTPSEGAIDQFFLQDEDDLFYQREGPIKESKYERVATDDVASQQKHLSPSQRRDLAKLLHKFDRLFSGKLGCYPHQKVHLDLLPEAKPQYQ